MLIQAEDEAAVDIGPDSVCSLRRIVGNRPLCLRPTAWAVRLACCGHVKVVCDRHRDLNTSLAPAKLICQCCRSVSPLIAAVWPI